MALQAGAGVQLAGACPKQRAEKPEPQAVSLSEWLQDAPHQGLKIHWAASMGKVAEAEDPLIPAGVSVIQGNRWKVRRQVEWDKPIEWKISTAVRSPSMEQLGEKFGGLAIKGAMSPGTKWPGCGE